MDAFDAKVKIGYYNDAEHKFDAIRIPFTGDEFAMVVVLPHYGNSLQFFDKFTGQQYQKLLQRVNQNHENVHYSIPVLNSSTVLINEKGASIYGDRFRDYIVREEIHDIDTSKLTYKRFLVNRPFGLIIYHEKSEIALLYALVRNPSLGLWTYPKFIYDIRCEHNIENPTYIP